MQQSVPGYLETSFAGAEANVAAVISQLGGESRFITALPQNPLGSACLRRLNAMFIDTSFVHFVAESRIGTYFIETGASQRPSSVLYDRADSAFTKLQSEKVDWDQALNNSTWFHVTGVTPALTENTAHLAIDGCKRAKARGLTVSCDLNFRSKLWRWDAQKKPRELAGQVMGEIVSLCDLVVGNEADVEDVFGISSGSTDVNEGRLEYKEYEISARTLGERYPNIQHVAFTLRESLSATQNKWGAMIYDVRQSKAHFAPHVQGEYKPYHIQHIVDRVGAGDAFAGSLIYALMSETYSNPEDAIHFAVASSCLAHSISGDFSFVEIDDVKQLMMGNASGRVKR